MYTHHTDSIARTTAHFASDPEVLALLLGGSIAHGYAQPTSDVDILILVSDADHERRRKRDQLLFFDRELCTYPNGYVDGKYLAVSFLDRVAESGSEPARFAFHGVQVLFSRVEHLAETLQAVTRYPVEHKADRLRRFFAQLEAWHWFAHEALRHDNAYLLGVAAGKLVLFGGRLVLAHNELLYPFHKWFLKVLESAPDKPAGLMQHIADVCASPSEATVDRFYELVKDWRLASGAAQTGAPDVPWGHQFLLDNELTWLSGHTPVDDL